MKSSTKDQVEGTLHEVKGQVKKAAGRIAGSPDLTAKGQAEALAGKAQKKVGEIKKVFDK
jgi:uncharacterized protein YjbJ (UPF0337 family)